MLARFGIFGTFTCNMGWHVQTAYIEDAVSQWHACIGHCMPVSLSFARQQQRPNKTMCRIASENKGGTHKEWRGQRGWVSLQSNSTDVCASELMSISA